MRMYRGQKKREAGRKRDGRVKENWITDNGHDPRGQHLYIQHLLLRISVKSSLKKKKKKKLPEFRRVTDDDRSEVCWKEWTVPYVVSTQWRSCTRFSKDAFFSLWRNDALIGWKIKSNVTHKYCIYYLNWENTPGNEKIHFHVIS